VLTPISVSHSARLARISGGMQDISAVRAVLLTHLVGDELVKFEQVLPETGISDKVVTHWWRLSLFLGRKTGDSPLGKLSSYLRGFFTDHQAM